MKVIINPSINNNTTITVPSSKSLAHRYIIAAALSDGVSVIDHIDFSDDIYATINALKNLKIEIIEEKNKLIIKGNSKVELINNLINCHESGSTLRFLIPMMTMNNDLVNFIGRGKLLQRPQNVYQKIYDERELLFKHNSEKIMVKGQLTGGNYIIDGSISSQFISGLLFVLPLMATDSTITIENNIESKSYLLLTIQALKMFNINVEMAENVIKVKGHQSYRATNISVEGDYSQAAFFMALGLINQEVSINNLNLNSLQGDKVMVDYIEKFNGRIEKMVNGYLIKPSNLNGILIDLQDCPDLGPIMMVLACLANQSTKIINIRRLRIKESDRVSAMVSELNKMGCEINVSENELTINGKIDLSGNLVFDSYNDHRIVMALSILSTICKHSNIIENAEAIDKSYPNFFHDLKKIGVDISYAS